MEDMMDLIKALIWCVEEAFGLFHGWKGLGIRLQLSLKELTRKAPFESLLGSLLTILEMLKKRLKQLMVDVLNWKVTWTGQNDSSDNFKGPVRFMF